jgi:hypothetical protein
MRFDAIHKHLIRSLMTAPTCFLGEIPSELLNVGNFEISEDGINALFFPKENAEACQTQNCNACRAQNSLGDFDRPADPQLRRDSDISMSMDNIEDYLGGLVV